jgi:uncharacterized protein
MARVVLDTNVYVSAILFGGIPERIIRLIQTDHQLVYSSMILDELLQVLGRKFDWSKKDINETVDFLFAGGIMCDAKHIPRVSRDADDDHVLACAVAADTEVIVTGDKDLLVLSPYQNICIMTPAAFLRYISHS